MPSQCRFLLRHGVEKSINQDVEEERIHRADVAAYAMRLNRASGEQYKKGKASPYSITERRVPELIPVLGSQPASDLSHKPGGRLPLLSARYPRNP